MGDFGRNEPDCETIGADSKEEKDEIGKLCDGLELVHLTCLEKADIDTSMSARKIRLNVRNAMYKPLSISKGVKGSSILTKLGDVSHT